MKCAEWYCRKEPEEEHFYEIFFRLCQKYNVRWASATPKEKAFIEEVTRVTYERDKAQRLGLPLSEVRHFLFRLFSESGLHSIQSPSDIAEYIDRSWQ